MSARTYGSIAPRITASTSLSFFFALRGETTENYASPRQWIFWVSYKFQ
jgi:hypothetical protein